MTNYRDTADLPPWPRSVEVKEHIDQATWDDYEKAGYDMSKFVVKSSDAGNDK